MAERNEKIFDRVRQELAKNANLGSRELYEMAKRADAAIGGDTLQQFHARYVLPLRREKSGRTGRGGAKPTRGGRGKAAKASAATPARKGRGAGRSGTKVASARDNARAVLLRFAQDFSAAETKSEIVKVMSRLDDYVDQISGNGA